MIFSFLGHWSKQLPCLVWSQFLMSTHFHYKPSLHLIDECNNQAGPIRSSKKIAVKGLKENSQRLAKRGVRATSLSSSAAMIGKRKDFFRQAVPYREATKAPAGQ